MDTNILLSLDDIPINKECKPSNAVNDKGFDNIRPPVFSIGMYFESVDDAKSFYIQYAIRKGFDIRTRSLKKGIDNQIRYFILVCSKKGKYVSTIPVERKSLPT